MTTDPESLFSMLCAICSRPLGVVGVATPGVICNEDEKWVHSGCEAPAEWNEDEGSYVHGSVA